MEQKDNLKLKFAHLAPQVWEALGSLKRTGWVNRGVRNPESVQEHTIELLNIANSLTFFSEVDKEDLLSMLEIHGWPEAINEDEVVLELNEEKLNKLNKDKFEKEKTALIEICESLGESGNIILELWLRFENSDDEVALFARQLDKYQAIEKSLEYEKSQGIKLFTEFLEYSRNKITHPFFLLKIQKLEEEYSDHILSGI